MTARLPSDRWYYAKDKKKVGPVSLAHLRRLLAEGALKTADMVLQEGTQKWRPLAEVAEAKAEPVSIGGKWKLALGSSVGLVLLALLGWGLVAMLPGPNDKKGVENPGPVAEIPGDPGAAKGTNNEAKKEPLLRKDKDPQVPKPREQADSGPKGEALVSAKRPTMVLQFGHSDRITCVAFSADGKHVLTGSADKTARLWDAASGREIRAFEGLTSEVISVAFSPDGKQVLTGSLYKMFRLWETASGKEIRTFQVPDPYLSYVGFSPDGKQVLTGSAYDGTVRLWDVASGEQIRAFRTAGSTKAWAFSPDGKQIFAGGGESRLWDSTSGKPIPTFTEHYWRVDCVAFSSDGKQIAGSFNGKLRLLDAASGKRIRDFTHTSVITSVAFSPDGKQVLTGSKVGANQGKVGNIARLWDAESGQEIRAFHLPVSFPNSGSESALHVAFSPDGKQVLTGVGEHNGTNLAKLWDAESGKEIRAFQRQVHYTRSVAFSPDGKRVLTGSADLKVRLWDLAGGRQILALHGHMVAVSPNGKQVLTAIYEYSSNKKTARLLDAETGQEIRAFQGSALAISPDGKQILTYTDEENEFLRAEYTARLWDATSGKEIRAFKGHKRAVVTAAFSPNGKQVLTASGALTVDHTARLWDAETGQEIRAFEGHAAEVTSVAFSPDGKQVLTGGTDSTARLWDAASGKQIRAFPVPTGFVYSVAFSPNGEQVLTGSTDNAARLWDAASGKEIRVFQGHADYVYSVAFSPDGKQVLTGSKDSTARLWDAVTGRELCRFLGFRDGSWIVITPDHYYSASKGVLIGVAFTLGNRTFPFEQFDLKFNRPDKVIERIGRASQEMVAAYRHAYEKRLKRTKFTEDMLSDDFHVPEIAVNSVAKLTAREKTLKLKVQAGDSKYLLDRLHVDVNGVPLHGTDGIGLRKQPSKTWEQVIEVELSAGTNKIDVSVLNEKGAESLKETLSIYYDAPASKPNLYVVAVGVSDYQDARFRLTYADKDARDLADLLDSKRDRFDDVKVLRILNRDATRENILKARDFLKGSQVDDLVVVFFAGHGLLDSKLDYYFATADIDFKNPAKRGLSYEAIEGLLEGSRARKKLLLMDTCHSGELDKDEVQVVGSKKQPEGEIKVRTFRGLDLEITPRVGLSNSYQLLQEMFADLRRGTGAVVIASAGGAEYALESAAWKNGVFTHALLRGLKGEADRNRDGRVQVSELRDFVEQEVRRLTNGRQVPTSRRENLVLDFTFD